MFTHCPLYCVTVHHYGPYYCPPVPLYCPSTLLPAVRQFPTAVRASAPSTACCPSMLQPQDFYFRGQLQVPKLSVRPVLRRPLLVTCRYTNLPQSRPLKVVFVSHSGCVSSLKVVFVSHSSCVTSRKVVFASHSGCFRKVVFLLHSFYPHLWLSLRITPVVFP